MGKYNTDIHTTIRCYKNVKISFTSFYTSKPIIRVEKYSPNPTLTSLLDYRDFIVEQHRLGLHEDEINWLLAWKPICDLFYSIPHKVITLSPHRAHCIIQDYPKDPCPPLGSAGRAL